MRKIKSGKERKGCWSHGSGRRHVVLFVMVREAPPISWHLSRNLKEVRQ